MSRTFTKLFFAVAVLFGVLNTAFADKYKATMVFGGIASGTSEDVDAEITKSEDGTYDITFIGFDASIQFLGDVEGGSANITKLKGTESNGLTLEGTGDSQFEIVGKSLDLKAFQATIDESGKGEGSFAGESTIGGFMTIQATCNFTLERVIDNDTIVKKELEFDDVPFYNKAIDLNKPNDTIKTNNDSSAVGIKLFETKASFAISDYEISVGDLALKQRLVLENLKYSAGSEEGAYKIFGATNMYVNEYKMYVPAVADINVSADGKIDGTINITIDMVVFRYKLTVVFGSQAEGVVIEDKYLEYEKTGSVVVKSDKTFVNDSLIYINENGILIENMQYSIVDQKMSLLIKDIKMLAADGTMSSSIVYKASKAEAYINVNDKNIYLKDIDIDFNLEVAYSMVDTTKTAALGKISILEADSATNRFIDPEGPFQYGLVGGMLISMTVDTTGNELDGYTANSEFKISGIYDLADGPIEVVKLTDLDAAREAAITAIKENNQRCGVSVTATDKAGNSSEFTATCFVTIAAISYEEILPDSTQFPSKVYADSTTGVAAVTFAPFNIEYVAKNDSLNLSKSVKKVAASIIVNNKTYSLPATVELPVGDAEIQYSWVNPYSGKEYSRTITVNVSAEDPTAVSNVASKTVSVIYKNGNLIVNGANDANVTVVNISGATVYTGKAGAINLHKGIYIVKVNGKAYKIIVK